MARNIWDACSFKFRVKSNKSNKKRMFVLDPVSSTFMDDPVTCDVKFVNMAPLDSYSVLNVVLKAVLESLVLV